MEIKIKIEKKNNIEIKNNIVVKFIWCLGKHPGPLGSECQGLAGKFFKGPIISCHQAI